MRGITQINKIMSIIREDLNMGRKKATAFVVSAAVIMLSMIIILSSCGKNGINIDGRRTAVLHGDGAIGAIEAIDDEVEFEITAPQAFVYSVDAGKIIYIKGYEKIIYPASTTKLLSIICALNVLGPDELVTPGDELELVSEHSSIAYVRSHHTLTVEMLIEGMLLPSGNDAAYALAAAAGAKLSNDKSHGKDAVKVFVDEMNRYASEIGMCGSHFTSPDGYFDGNHYSTVEDMALLSSIASKNTIIMRYASLLSDDVTYASGHTITWHNTNLMINPESEYYSPCVTGLKTGTLEGNVCLICTFSAADKDYIAGVFTEPDSETRFGDMKKIVDYYTQKG